MQRLFNNKNNFNNNNNYNRNNNSRSFARSAPLSNASFMTNRPVITPSINVPTNSSHSSHSVNAFSQELAKVPLLQSTQQGLPYLIWRKKLQSAINAGGLKEFFFDTTPMAVRKASIESSKADYFAIASSLLTELAQKNLSSNRDSIERLFAYHKWLPYWFCAPARFLPYLPTAGNANNRVFTPTIEEFNEVLDELPSLRKQIDHFKQAYHPNIDQPPRERLPDEPQAILITPGEGQTRFLKFVRICSEANICNRNVLETEHLLQMQQGGITDPCEY